MTLVKEAVLATLLDAVRAAGLDVQVDPGPGSWLVELSEGALYCTPFWEGAEGIATELHLPESGCNWSTLVSCDVIPYELTGDVASDAARFVSLVRPLLAIAEGR